MIKQCLGYVRHIKGEVIEYSCKKTFNTLKTRRLRCPECSYYNHLEVANKNPKKRYYSRKGKGKERKTHDTFNRVKYIQLKKPVYNQHTLRIEPVGGRFERAVDRIIKGEITLTGGGG